jgi:hypothetical protein
MQSVLAFPNIAWILLEKGSGSIFGGRNRIRPLADEDLLRSVAGACGEAGSEECPFSTPRHIALFVTFARRIPQE